MSKHILVIKGSPRKKGNTSALADAFAEGAKESGNTVAEAKWVASSLHMEQTERTM